MRPRLQMAQRLRQLVQEALRNSQIGALKAFAEAAKDGCEQTASLVRTPLMSWPGDYIDLAAEMECLTVISNCPQILNPANNFKSDAGAHGYVCSCPIAARYGAAPRLSRNL